MAAVTHRVSTASTSNTTSYTSGAFTPAVGDLLLVWVSASATLAAGSVTGTGAGLTFTKVTSRVRTADSTAYLFIANALVTAASSQTVTFVCTGDAATGCVIQVASVSAMVRTGTGAVQQTSGQDNQALGGTPAPVFGASCLTANPTLGLVFNETNPATMTPPTSWTERNDTGYATPTTGAEYVSRDSGFTGTTITWGGTSASAFASIGVELDTTAPVGVSAETDTSVGRAISVGVGVSAETDTAVSRAVSAAPGVSVETDVSVGRALTVGVGASVETDTALALTEASAFTYGISTETDVSVGRAVSVGVGVSLETDTAVARALTVGVGVSLETDTAFALIASGAAPAVSGGWVPGRRKRATREDLLRLGMTWLVEPSLEPATETARTVAVEIITLAREARARGEPYVGGLSMPRALVVPLSVLQPAAPDLPSIGIAVQQARKAARSKTERAALDRWVAAVLDRAATAEQAQVQDEEDLLEVMAWI